MTKVLEKQLERHFSQECKRLGVTSLKLHLRFSTGWPDRIVVINKKVIWVELKTLTGVLSPRQIAVHELLRSLNHKILVLRTKEEITNVLESTQLPNKSRKVSSRKRLRTTLAGSRIGEDQHYTASIEDSTVSKSD